MLAEKTAGSSTLLGVLSPRQDPIEWRASSAPANSTFDIASCQTAADLHRWLLTYARSLGFYGARYIHLGHPLWHGDRSEPNEPLRFLSTSVRDQRDDGIGEWLLLDPAVLRVRTDFAPFAWTMLGKPSLTPRQKAWVETERRLGIEAGLAVPVQDYSGGPAYLSFFGMNEEGVLNLIETRAPHIAFDAARFHALAKQLVLPANRLDATPKLTSREIECLRLAALGKTVDESGSVLKISGRTVEFHLANAANKLGVASKLRAVVVALGSGILHI